MMKLSEREKETVRLLMQVISQDADFLRRVEALKQAKEKEDGSGSVMKVDC